MSAGSLWSSLPDGRTVGWLTIGAVCGGATMYALMARRGGKQRAGGEGEIVSGVDFRGQPSRYVRSSDGGVVGLLAYNVCEPLTKEEYDKWLFDVHYHDIMANPFLQKISLRTVRADKPARLSSGASVTNEVEFFRLAELHFSDFEAYDRYIEWFQANAIPPPRTPAGKSAFKFYLLSESQSILRV